MFMHRFFRLAMAFLGLLALQAEGPHVIWEAKQARVLDLVEGKLRERRLGPPWNLELLGLPMLALTPEAPGIPESTLPEPSRMAAVSDIHGNLRGLVRLLQAHRIVDAHLRWTYGTGHLVVVGDVADRGDQVTEAYWLLRSLEAQALPHGGRVHLLLGNHDVMLMRGSHRYLHPRYKALEATFPRNIQGLMAADTELGRWLRSRPVALRLGRTLFVHAGLEPATPTMSLDQLNQAFRAELDAPGKPPLLGARGPVWYRGLLPLKGGPDEATEADVRGLLARFGAEAMVVGHSTLEAAQVFHGGAVFGIDAGLKDGRPGNLWIRERGTVYRGLPDGRREVLWAPSKVPLRPLPSPLSTKESPCPPSTTSDAGSPVC